MVAPEIWIPLVVVGVSAFFMAVYGSGKEMSINPFKDKNLLERGLTMPTIWLYYNDSDVNSRLWQDFGARSARVLNVPFLNLCYNRIVELNKKTYKVEVIGGLTDLASRLGGWQEMPKGLQTPLASVGAAELNWIRAEVLAKFGGLWVHPATIALKPFPLIPHERVVFYGTDPDETYSGPNGTTIPSMYVMGAGKAKNPIFEEWAQAAFERLDQQGGGNQIREDAKWDFTQFAASKDTVDMLPNEELSRCDKGGKRIQVENLLAIGPSPWPSGGKGRAGDLCFHVTKEAIYVPVPWKEINDRRMFGWFLRMSEEQILASELVISDLLQS